MGALVFDAVDGCAGGGVPGAGGLEDGAGESAPSLGCANPSLFTFLILGLLHVRDGLQ